MTSRYFFKVCFTLILVSCFPYQEKPSDIKSDQGDLSNSHFHHSSTYNQQGDIEFLISLSKAKTIKVLLSPYQGLKILDTQGGSLNPEHIKIIKDSISKIRRKEPPGPKQEFLIKVLDYLSLAPLGTPIFLNLPKEDASTNGIKCIMRGRSYPTNYTLGTAAASKTLPVDKEFCYGRCGIGCDTRPSVWTQNCLNLDACGLAAGDPNSPLCQDEWRQSADDWILGHLFGCEIKDARY